MSSLPTFAFAQLLCMGCYILILVNADANYYPPPHYLSDTGGEAALPAGRGERRGSLVAEIKEMNREQQLAASTSARPANPKK
jgi:hypothetical protein